MKPLLISSGEPAGIGPDLCLELAQKALPLVVLGDEHLLKNRAKRLGKKIRFIPYHPEQQQWLPGELSILHIPCSTSPIPGLLDPRNASYVLTLIQTGAKRCLSGEFSAFVTAPINKTVINQAGITFSGHTEFLAELCRVDSVVMMLACPQMKVALATTHLPLKDVPITLTKSLLTKVILTLNESLQNDFGISEPKIAVAGLNPHAGEAGYLGHEEIETIIPVLETLRGKGLTLIGPLPADTMFTPKYIDWCDAVIAMYHDQGLPVLKFAGFGKAVNITLGLPIIRTSVDHGTAIDLAGKGLADPGSLFAAVDLALEMVHNRQGKT
ncbi:4-hydroxythreonine-4-phosphate dehydrogenase PdxA [Legionella impletisoli]|uniref:4-hydroxythreonine-4-phosphate dehydrogenase n=1 Tax=Legionella impletisoli TaxID=343510 RepID=A0A917K1X9_9GAMM|nr:4-hydroxythreonine-4-phosphate dehydrogenase PdxA [Legionella impletisoli]GGI93369.1 4-hydroxythreonine-4-phosphate dehydrogenase [Legionella impletisoli]